MKSGRFTVIKRLIRLTKSLPIADPQKSTNGWVKMIVGELDETRGSDWQLVAVGSDANSQRASTIDLVGDLRDEAALMRNLALRLSVELRQHRPPGEIETLLFEQSFWDTPAQRQARSDLCRQAVDYQDKLWLG